MQTGYTWYGHDLSYFSRKLEAALIFYGLDFERAQVRLGEVEETARKRAGTHIIPVLQTPEGWALWDTTPIMFLLDGRAPGRRMFGSGEKGVLAHIVENFLDEWLGRTMVHYRWHYKESADFAAPLLAVGNAQAEAGIRGWGLKACRATGVEPAYQQEMAEMEYRRIIEAVEAQLTEARFLMGNAPSAVDAVILGGLWGHTLADPAPRRMVTAYPRVVKWAESSKRGWDGSGTLTKTPTDFAKAMIAEMKTAFLPFALGNRAALAAGKKGFMANVYGEDVSYLARPYPERACQMVSDHIRRENAEDMVRALGLADLYL